MVINGIISFQLTPGSWLQSHDFWTGFFNPTYWSSTVLRTGICVMMAAAFMLFPAARSGEASSRLLRYIGLWLVAGCLVGYAGYRWWEAQLPDTVRALFLGDSPTLQTLAATRSFTVWAVAAALALAVVFLLVLPRSIKLVVPGLLIMAAAFSFFSGFERVREGSR